MGEKKSILLPFTNTARKYGYITWREEFDNCVRKLLGKRRSICLIHKGTVLKDRNIDWKKRRIGITYTLTRSAALRASKIKLIRIKNNTFRIVFSQ